jgi:hypothetical protein
MCPSCLNSPPHSFLGLLCVTTLSKYIPYMYLRKKGNKANNTSRAT